MKRIKWPITGRQYIRGFFCVVLLLAVVRLIFPEVAGESRESGDAAVMQDTIATLSENKGKEADKNEEGDRGEKTNKRKGESRRGKHPIYSVPSYRAAFPDDNDVQMAAAKRHGVSPVEDRKDAEMRMNELVYMEASPYYHVDPLTSSVPYLVPRAAILLGDIGRAFFDSLHVKGIPLHKPIVTSVLRTKKDIRRLRRVNVNATENSCHLYGTTFDICYTRFKTVSPPEGKERRMVSNDTLKWVLSEVMRDMREQGRCHIKYEVKQACFHMTVR